MADYKLLGYSKNNKKVVYDPVGSHTATHFEDTPELKDLVIEALAAMVLEDEQIDELPINMGRIIGLTDGVTNDRNDEIVYAKRKHRNHGWTPFNKTQKSRPSPWLVVSLTQISNDTYELMSTFIGDGESSPPFPGEPNETPDSKDYWSSHSLAWGTQEIQQETLTNKCPW
jgi:hypothetical protein